MAFADLGNVFADDSNHRFYLINFKPNSASFMPGHEAYLNTNVKSWINGLDPKKKWGIGIAGGASATGTAAGNYTLSVARAKSVESWLAKNTAAFRSPHIKTMSTGVGMTNAEKDPTTKLPPKQREEAQNEYRNVFCFVSELNVPPPPPSPIEEFTKARSFEIRQTEQLSYNQTVGPGTAGVQLDAKVDFEIKDSEGRVGIYTYTGIGVSLGPSVTDMLGSKLKGAKWGKYLLGFEEEVLAQVLKKTFKSRFADFLLAASKASGITKQVTKGPWTPFRNRGLRSRTVSQWEGEMQLTQYGVITNLPDTPITPEILKKIAEATGNTILNFGGHDVVIPDMKPGYAAHVENFTSGNVTFPGILQLASSMGRLFFKGLA